VIGQHNKPSVVTANTLPLWESKWHISVWSNCHQQAPPLRSDAFLQFSHQSPLLCTTWKANVWTQWKMPYPISACSALNTLCYARPERQAPSCRYSLTLQDVRSSVISLLDEVRSAYCCKQKQRWCQHCRTFKYLAHNWQLTNVSNRIWPNYISKCFSYIDFTTVLARLTTWFSMTQNHYLENYFQPTKQSSR